AAMLATAEEILDRIDLKWSDEAALTVVMAAKGYPGRYDKGSEIKGLAEAAAIPGVKIFHAGTEARDGRVIATGGRVLNVAATGKTVGEARARAYAAIARIDWPGGFCRSDIGTLAIAREKA
ncbi:MAG: phosphoribosylamine--glycine ligase, partial [Hyphomicrobiaceae bacterium]